MRALRIVLILVFGSALILSMISAYRDRLELQKITAANDFLRKQLGEMTIALTSKEKEIDRLEQSQCLPARPPEGGRKAARLQ
jgi:hypothetical protein